MEKNQSLKKKKKELESSEEFLTSSLEDQKTKIEELEAEFKEEEEEKPRRRKVRRKKKEPELSEEEKEILAMVSPESLSMIFKWVDGTIVATAKIRPATEEELLNLSKAWSLVAQKRLPAWLLQYGDLVMAVAITSICYGGRYLEKVREDQKKAKKKGEEKTDERKKAEGAKTS